MSDEKIPTEKKEPSQNQLNTGTVFMGPSPDKESSLKQVIGSQGQEIWNRRTVSEYMTRVRERATIHVQAMLDKARANAETIRKTAKQWAEKTKKESDNLHEQAQQTLQDAERIHKEAEHIRELAHEEGYRLGIKQAQEEVAEQIKSIHMTAASILKTIERQYPVIFENWRSDLAELLCTATEVATGWILSKEHIAILDSVLSSAVQQLEERQRITIRVHPNNKNAIVDLITNIKNQFPELKNWEIKTDGTMDENDLIVESRSGMVDSNSHLRKKEVADILQQLILPESEIDYVAAQSIADITESTGITALAKEAEKIHHISKQNNSSEGISPSSLKLSFNKEEHNSSSKINPMNVTQEEIEFTFPELDGVELPPDTPPSEATQETSSILSPITESSIDIHSSLSKLPNNDPNTLISTNIDPILLPSTTNSNNEFELTIPNTLSEITSTDSSPNK